MQKFFEEITTRLVVSLALVLSQMSATVLNHRHCGCSLIIATDKHETSVALVMDLDFFLMGLRLVMIKEFSTLHGDTFKEYLSTALSMRRMSWRHWRD